MVTQVTLKEDRVSNAICQYVATELEGKSYVMSMPSNNRWSPAQHRDSYGKVFVNDEGVVHQQITKLTKTITNVTAYKTAANKIAVNATVVYSYTIGDWSST